ncbi:hypothetical protein Rsub_08237 [Raphidocelis subcapitata]|uniref:Ribosome biogenesis GTPase n=1 Tax=Raphidocelis subcapitata TaxID=307507 RepID=A0A2V0P7F4_9CHLO|nr:hypothetical protein Rsub_08237 [Raphidocelis subcapitata]|eukprot:GBF95801.1 hypothetical protein Rsub_08237 [Raphidocelis subcapitata]
MLRGCCCSSGAGAGGTRAAAAAAATTRALPPLLPSAAAAAAAVPRQRLRLLAVPAPGVSGLLLPPPGRGPRAGWACALHAMTGGAAAAAAAGARRAEWSAYPTTATGRVMAAEANYVRVDVQRLGADPEASIAPASSSSSGGSSGGSGGSGGSGSAAAASASTSTSGAVGASSQQQQQQQQKQQQQGPPDAAAQPELRAPPRAQLLCTVRALLKKVQQRVLVGDVVSVGSIDWGEGRGVVEAVAPRRSELVDPAVANVDHAVLLFGLTQPPFEEMQVSRFLVSIEAAGLPLTLALNKADLVDEAEVEARVAQCAEWGYKAVAISCASGRGLADLAAALAGKTSVVAGPSGAGKSSLINALRMGRHKEGGEACAAGPGGEDELRGVRWATGSGGGGSGGLDEEEEGEGECAEEEEGAGPGPSAGAEAAAAPEADPAAGPSGRGGGFLAVGDVSARSGRGRHTTRTVRLIPLPGGGLMADTPGFGLPTLDRVASADLGELFPEFRAARRAAPGGGCRFVDCAHVAEPGCAVSGVGLERYPHYLKFLAELKARGGGGAREDYDVRVMQLAKKQREGAVKLMTGRGGAARLEARLESKRHRVTSRKAAKQSLQRAAVEGEDADGGGGPVM